MNNEKDNKLVELEDNNLSSSFDTKFMIFDQLLNDLTQEISTMMKDLVKDPEIIDGKEVFPEGVASLTIESSLYAHTLIKSSREVKQSLLGCYNALKKLKELEND